MNKKTKASKNPDSNVLQVREGLEGIAKTMNTSQVMARLSTRGHMTAHAHLAYAGFSKEQLSVTDIDAELRANGDAVTGGDLGRLERTLTSQFLTLDAIFANLSERANRQEYIKNMDTFLRLALKAQSQARATAEALALIKNPMPYIKQANIAQGHQQVNNGVPAHSAHAADSSFEQSKLLAQQQPDKLESVHFPLTQDVT
jgi:hypothetical protein